MDPHRDPPNHFHRPPPPNTVRFTGLVPAGHFAGYVDSNLRSQNLPDGHFVPGLVFIPRASFSTQPVRNSPDPIVAFYGPPNVTSAPSPLLFQADNHFVNRLLAANQNGPRGPRQL